MELIDVLHKISEESLRASQPTDIVIGTVSQVNPLAITINTAMAPIQQSLLYLTENVVEKKITALNHTHTVSSSTTSAGLEDVYCMVNGEQLPADSDYITITRALQVGDKVLMLRVQKGQKFIVLSRIY